MSRAGTDRPGEDQLPDAAREEPGDGDLCTSILANLAADSAPIETGQDQAPAAAEGAGDDGISQQAGAADALPTEEPTEPAPPHAAQANAASPATEVEVPSPPAEPEAGLAVPPEAGQDLGELEELTLPSSIEPLKPLSAGETVGPEGQVAIVGLRTTRGRINMYSARLTGEPHADEMIDLLEGPADHPGLARQADVLSQVHYSMFPSLYASWVDRDRRYLALEQAEGDTLQDALHAGMEPDALLSVVLQIAQALRRLQAAGWAAVGLSPESVVMCSPIRLVGLSTAVRIGDLADTPLQNSGYSAPELALPGPVTGREDVYTLGALLYRGLAGLPLGEEGSELGGLSSTIHVAGAPQLLASALAPTEERADLEDFYQRLLAFKRRLTTSSLALRIASGTTIGLNPTRVTNEDACGYLSWTSAYEGRSSFNAILCVVDGMGGMEAGEVASTAALRAVLNGVASYAARNIGEAPGSDIQTEPGSPEPLHPAGLVQSAAESVYTAAHGRQVGATITCVAVEDGALRLAHVGDTRAYLLREGVMRQLTRDHSLVAAMVLSGVISADEARGHPESNKVLRSLGGQRTLPEEYVDSLEQAYGEQVLHLRPDDLLLLCSDGVWGQIEDDRLRDLCEWPDPESAVEAILQAALEAGAPDNASVVIGRCYALDVR